MEVATAVEAAAEEALVEGETAEAVRDEAATATGEGATVEVATAMAELDAATKD